MLTFEELEALKAGIPGDPARTRLLETIRGRAEPVMARMPPIPRVKALLSRDGGVCPNDGHPLKFDPWSPEEHECPKCGKHFSGSRHHRHWARAQHLWLAERMAELALLAHLTDDRRAAARAAELIGEYDELYFELPNRDNVLGPSHLFFSTYLESLWITAYLAAAFMLREIGALSEEQTEGVNRVADEAARIIGEFDEGLSNRQTWNAAALTAIAAWFGDEELARATITSRTGLLGHLTDGFGADGLWWEGENYHLFALRGLMQGIHWARSTGFDLLDDPVLLTHFREALLAPSRSALPDFTYPARRDSRYGVSLAQPVSIELWEIGRAWLGPDETLLGWLNALYCAPPPASPPLLYDAWLHNEGRPPQPNTSLSWWALTGLADVPAPELVPDWNPGSALLADQGLAVLRIDGRYASLECGREIRGHGHPDRLHLTLHANGMHWLPDPGTGSYVEPELFWYRSALAHNAPLLDGTNAGGEDGRCEAFEAGEQFAWCRGRAGSVRRTVILGTSHLLDIVEFEGAAEPIVELPWHLQGEISVETPGDWQPARLEHPFVSEAEQFVPSTAAPLVVEVRNPLARAPLRVFMHGGGAALIRAAAPGLPNTHTTGRFLMVRAHADRLRWVTVLGLAAPGAPESVSGMECAEQEVRVTTGAGVFRYRLTESGAEVEHPGGKARLAGLKPVPSKRTPIFAEKQIADAEAFAPLLSAPPALDGTLDGFDTAAPLLLDSEHQYRRSEEPYDPEAFRAEAWVNWDGEALYLAVAVSKPEVSFRSPEAAPLGLDNEAEDINSDGLELFLNIEGGAIGTIVIPREDGGLHSRALPGVGGGGGEGIPGIGGALEVEGNWARTDDGYLVTLRLVDPRLVSQRKDSRIGFDLLINEMQPDRQRRAGQLVWGGAGGWVYLRGDRHDPKDFGILGLE